MRIELQGGPADGLQEDVPDDITELFLTDIGPAREGPDPFEGESLGRMAYVITDQTSEDGAVIFRYTGSTHDHETGTD
jgi:hypothetical protein